MSDFEKRYERFKITAKEADNLRRLAEPALHLRRAPNRVIVETVVIEDGDRRVVKTEVQSAQLV